MQHRKSGARGEAVKQDRDGWVMVEFYHPTRTFGEHHENELIVLVKGDRQVG